MHISAVNTAPAPSVEELDCLILSAVRLVFPDTPRYGRSPSSEFPRLRSGCVSMRVRSSVPVPGRAWNRCRIPKTHTLDLFGSILDPIGYGPDLDTYYDNDDIPVRVGVFGLEERLLLTDR